MKRFDYFIAITDNHSALTDELELREDNSDAIQIFLSFLTVTVLFA